MLRKGGFKGTMTKHSFGVTKDNVFVNISIKHTSVDPHQSFLESFERENNMLNIHSLFDAPVEWDNLKIKLDEYPFFYEVEFDKIVFVARLISIAVAKKVKGGVSSFEYILTFSKDVEGDNKDSIAAKTYLKYKEENEEGKKVLVEFDVILKHTDAPPMETSRSEPSKVKDEIVF